MIRGYRRRPTAADVRRAALVPILAAWTLAASALPVPTLAADGISILSTDQTDVNGDGRPDVIAIDAAFITPRDRIVVFDGDGSMSRSKDWRQATDFHADTWLYDIGADGSTQLIVRYALESGHSVAYVYDDRDGDGEVAHVINGIQIDVTESPYWTARIESAADWYRPDGSLDLGLSILLDGPIPTLDRAPEEFIRDFMPHDGVADVSFTSVTSTDGVARYAVRRLLARAPADWSFERAWLWSNVGRFPTHPNARAFFPFLPAPTDPQDPANIGLRYFDLPPDLVVDWERGVITAVKLDGYPIGRGYHMNSNSYMKSGEISAPSFESPQAYYDLAGDSDGYADLHIRFFTRPESDKAMYTVPNADSRPWQAIGYDWNLFGPATLRWDYKISVAGDQRIDSVVRFDDFGLRTVPYDDLPEWVTSHEWKLTTLLAREGEGYQSSEGLYEWMANTGDDPEGDPERAFAATEATLGYMFGASVVVPDAFFQNAHVGFRAERRLERQGRPELYLSAIDKKLHLVGAEAGVWNVDGRTSIHYDNVMGTDHLDHWQVRDGDAVRSELYALPGWLLYQDHQRVLLKKTDVTPALLVTEPPTDRTSWSAMAKAVAGNAPDFAPDDLLSMYQHIRGRTWRVQGASISAVRPTKGGFRFLIDLRANARIPASLPFSLSRDTTGPVVVEHSKGWRTDPLTPAAIALSLDVSSATALRENAVRVRLSNTGLDDVRRGALELVAATPEGDSSVVDLAEVSVDGAGTISRSLMWVPRAGGTWTLTARLRLPDGAIVVGPHTRVDVTAEDSPPPVAVLAASTGYETPLLVSTAVIAFSLLLGSVVWSATRRGAG
jgi:hypothetical protein